jgi:hypothetical protein
MDGGNRMPDQSLTRERRRRGAASLALAAALSSLAPGAATADA